MIIKELHMIPEDIFYNKKLSDNLRDIVINSTCNFATALKLLKKSGNNKRNVKLIKELYNSSVSEKDVND